MYCEIQHGVWNQHWYFNTKTVEFNTKSILQVWSHTVQSGRMKISNAATVERVSQEEEDEEALCCRGDVECPNPDDLSHKVELGPTQIWTDTEILFTRIPANQPTNQDTDDFVKAYCLYLFLGI